jgi:NitT/TauT family transport system substrate-binding protein
MRRDLLDAEHGDEMRQRIQSASARRWRVIAVAGLLAAFATACGGEGENDVAAGGEAGKPLDKITIATPNIGISFLPFYVARDLGIFEKHGLDAEVTHMKSDVAVAALQTGDVHFMGGIGSATRAALQGQPVKVVTVVANSPNHVLISSPGIKEIDQLRGKVIAGAPPGNTVNVVTRELLSQNGVEPDQYDLINAGPGGADRSAAFVNGVADATLYEPTGAVLLEDGTYNLLAKASDSVNLPFTGLAVSEKLLADDEDLVRRTIKALLEATRVVSEDPERSVPVLEKEFELTPEQAKGVFDTVADSWEPSGMASAEAVEFELTVDKEELELDEDLETLEARVYDFSLVEAL